ncbi:hypothetical protein H0H81_005395 [Sphagnurus paluster]|uniref:Uncharacterized protein n=1 Tax=Sphagnurus paluster TaxID=117069 RepID=A0A9P7GSG0_9AGAR|nr:hypothetical protein H0H81_005395 [Sphagnurus paluster]
MTAVPSEDNDFKDSSSPAKTVCVESTNTLKPQSIQADSATESEDDDSVLINKNDALDPGASYHHPTATPLVANLNPSTHIDASPAPHASAGPSKPNSRSGPGLDADSDSEGSPIRPTKKQRTPVKDSSSDDDSEAKRKRRVAQLKNGSGAGVKRGTRQPIKRGGKRF